MTLVTNTPANVNVARTDFIKNKFDTLIWEKGYDVILEKSFPCPCISRNSNQLSSCANCGGSGYIFINPTETRAVLSAMNMDTKFKEWGKENIGTASVSALSEDEVSFMDRITVTDGIAIFTEALFVKQIGDNSTRQYFFTTIYNVKEITYLALFRGATQTLLPLLYGTDFTYTDNKILFLTASTYIDPNITDEQDISIVIRYKYAPVFHIIDIQRETMQSFINIANEGEAVVNLPIHAVARRLHYVLNRENFNGTRILNNDHVFQFADLNPAKQEC